MFSMGNKHLLIQFTEINGNNGFNHEGIYCVLLVYNQSNGPDVHITALIYMFFHASSVHNEL